jgi:hypothetical protein
MMVLMLVLGELIGLLCGHKLGQLSRDRKMEDEIFDFRAREENLKKQIERYRNFRIGK